MGALSVTSLQGSNVSTLTGNVGALSVLSIQGNDVSTLTGNVGTMNIITLNAATISSASLYTPGTLSQINIGSNAGSTLQQLQCIAIGEDAGRYQQQNYAVAVGLAAGFSNQGTNGISIGSSSGLFNQAANCVAVGTSAGRVSQGTYAISVGYAAGLSNQGSYAIAIGYLAGSNAQNANSIVLCADSSGLNAAASGLFIKPVRAGVGASGSLKYNTGTNEITYDAAKTFVIQHPTNPEKHLVHACLEGPEAGVYYRGTGTIVDSSAVITLPDYVQHIASEFTVQVTPIYNGTIRTLNASCVSNNSFTVYGSSGDFYWHVYGKRVTIEVEPDKASTVVHGDGPYRWIDTPL